MISERLVHKSFVVKKYMDKACWNSEKELYQSLKNVETIIIQVMFMLGIRIQRRQLLLEFFYKFC